VGKKYTVTVAFFDPDPTDNPKRDVRTMLYYGERHQDHTANVIGEIVSEDYEDEDE
jgi:hypothetical protein